MTSNTDNRTGDLEMQPAHLSQSHDREVDIIVDIEHVEVEDDPRKWSAARKKTTLAMIACAALIATMGANIYNPAIQQVEEDLQANDAEIALSLSLYIIFQGSAPNLWAAVTEIKGRKVVYLISFAFYIASNAVCGVSNSVGLLIGMRVLQAISSAAVMTIGAGTLADIYDPKERGSMLGVYYAAPLLGPAIGPILGGVLTRAWSWRATFYVLSALASILFIAFLFFKDTFRRERSLAYQAALRRLRRRQALKDKAIHQSSIDEKNKESHGGEDTEPDFVNGRNSSEGEGQVQAQPATTKSQATSSGSPKKRGTGSVGAVKLTLGNVNPLPQVAQVLRRKNNILMYFPSGLIFAIQYSIVYTCSITLFAPPYNYDALRVGLVLLSFGIATFCRSITGSLLGGRWSDIVLAKLKKANGGMSYPEMRLESTKLAMPILPASVLAYAWFTNQHLHIATVAVALFFVGFSSLWIYSSTLAYIVDANVGRSSNAVATNSFARGLAAFVASEAAVPLQRSIGDGGLYTIWAVLCVFLDLSILFAIIKGGKWREEAEERENAHVRARALYEKK